MHLSEDTKYIIRLVWLLAHRHPVYFLRFLMMLCVVKRMSNVHMIGQLGGVKQEVTVEQKDPSLAFARDITNEAVTISSLLV
jgi:hypothetical protein